MDQKYRLHTLQAALELIDLFLESPECELGVTEISRSLDMPKSQVYRILQNLSAYGYIQKNEERRKYHLGLKFLFAGHVVSQHLDLLQAANPILDQLCQATDETVHLVLKTNRGPVCVAERQSTHQLRFFASIGVQLPWHAGSASKLLLAYLPHEQQTSILSNNPLEPYTSNTITEPHKLKEELRRIAADGFATSAGEMNVGARAVAAPIHDYTGGVVAAVSVIGPSQRLDDGKMQEITRLVMQAGRTISTRLGSTAIPNTA